MKNTLMSSCIVALIAMGVPAFAKTHAVVVGINDYTHLRPLCGAVNDADDIAAALEARGVDQLVKLTDHEASKQAILSTLRETIDGAEPGDTVFFSYAGHGDRIFAAHPDEEEDGLDEFLALSDYNPGNLGTLETAAIIDNEFDALFGRRDDIKIVFVSDSCHSGTIDRNQPVADVCRQSRYAGELRSGELRASPYALPDDIDLDAYAARIPRPSGTRDHVVTVSAVQDDQRVPEIFHHGMPRGALSVSVAEIIRDENHTFGEKITFEDLSTFVRRNVTTLAERLQVPEIRYNYRDTDPVFEWTPLEPDTVATPEPIPVAAAPLPSPPVADPTPTPSPALVTQPEAEPTPQPVDAQLATPTPAAESGPPTEAPAEALPEPEPMPEPEPAPPVISPPPVLAAPVIDIPTRLKPYGAAIRELTRPQTVRVKGDDVGMVELYNTQMKGVTLEMSGSSDLTFLADEATILSHTHDKLTSRAYRASDIENAVRAFYAIKYISRLSVNMAELETSLSPGNGVHCPPAQIEMTARRTGDYGIMFNIASNGEVQPIEFSNVVSKDTTRGLAALDMSFRAKIVPPFGRDTVVVVSSDSLPKLSTLWTRLNEIAGSNRPTGEQAILAALELLDFRKLDSDMTFATHPLFTAAPGSSVCR